MLKYLSGLIVLLTMSALTASAESVPHWTEVKSPHFTVLTDSSEKDGRRVAVQFERMRAVFHVLTPAASDDAGSPIVVLALKDRKSFRTLEPEAYLAKGQLELAGFFLRAQDKNYVLVRLDAEGEHPFATVYHEYTHYMLRRTEGWMPLWVNEGMAEFFQNATLEDKSVHLGEPSSYDIQYLRENSLLPITTLLAVDHASPYYHDEQKGSVFYAESWALVHYLEVTDYTNKTDLMPKYLKLVAQRQDPVKAAQQAFGDLNKLQDALSGYVHRPIFSAFKLLAPVPFDEATLSIRPIATTQADAVRADVLLDVGRSKDALALLDSVLKTEPTNALAHETMGAMKFREHDVSGAKKWYGEAVELDSQSYLAHYYFAAITLQSDSRDQDDAIERSLQTAFKLNPAFAPAYDALGNFYASRHEKLPEARLMASHAVQLEPENLGYRLNAAAILAEDQQWENALNVLKAARPLAKSLNETGMLGERIAQIEGVQAAMQRAGSPQADASGAKVSTLVVTDARVSAPGATAAKELEYPSGAPAGPHHTVAGVIRGVSCTYPTVLTLRLEGLAKPLTLYTNNYFKVAFTTVNFQPTKDLLPCTGIEGMKAKVEYGEVSDKRVSGQILSVELSK